MRTKSSAFVAISSTLALAACGDTGVMEPGPEPAATCLGQPAQRIRSAITQNTTWNANTRYLLSGRIDVTNRATLTIEPGTTICGDADQTMMNVSYLNIDQDAKLIAAGTAERPIVFTSSRPQGQRRPQDWGGVVLRGRAPINNPPDAGKGPETVCAQAEASAGSYGPCGTPRADDNSGTLRYLRIEFAGREFAPDKELNSLSLYAIGSGTTLEYIQVHRGSDDGFEFFGGTANLRYAVASACQDDAFDWEFGWVGKGQFWVATQDRNIGNRGFEGDNNRMNAALDPHSSPTISHVTLLGLGRGNAPGGSDKREGLALRSGVQGRLSNLIVAGFSDAGLALEEATVAGAKGGLLSLQGALFFQNGPAGDAKNISDTTTLGSTAFDVKAWVLGQPGNIEADPLLTDPFNPRTPSFLPRPGSPALQGGRAPTDSFFTPAAHLGAFGDTDWTAGWTAYPEN
jgi:hypothetical protein